MGFPASAVKDLRRLLGRMHIDATVEDHGFGGISINLDEENARALVLYLVDLDEDEDDDAP